MAWISAFAGMLWRLFKKCGKHGLDAYTPAA